MGTRAARALAAFLLIALATGPLAAVAQISDVASSTPVAELVPEQPATTPILTTDEGIATTTLETDIPTPEPVMVADEASAHVAIHVPNPTLDPETYVHGEIVVKYKEGRIDLVDRRDQRDADQVAEDYGLETKDVIEGQNVAILATTTALIEEAIDKLNDDPNIEYAEPNYIRHIDAVTPNDVLYAEQWALPVIQAPEAWDIATGTDVVVAVIDTGVDFTHPDLMGHKWDGADCRDSSGVALGGCDGGYDFADSDKDPSPVSASSTPEHGTIVAGTIAASLNNSIGTVGIAPNVKIMALRFKLDTSSEAEAIDFAIANGAKIINASYAGSASSTREYLAIKRFKEAGGIFVSAAANGADDYQGDDLDNLLFTMSTSTPPTKIYAATSTPAYPAQHTLDNIISVAATDEDDELSYYSNYGALSVDLGAPGDSIVTPTFGGGYATSTGTSLATPFVAGTAALLASASSTASASEIKKAILDGGDSLVSLHGKTVSGKRLNAYEALLAIGASVPIVATSTGTSTSPAPADTEAPTIELLGENPMNLIVGDTFTDPGAVVNDNGATTTINGVGVVDTTTAGTYTLLYTATDAAHNEASTTRAVIVTAPAPVSSGGGGGGGSSSSSSSSSGGGGGGGSSSTSGSAAKTPVPEPSVPRLPQTPSGQVLGASTYTFTLNLSIGSTGSEVTELQKKLAALGFFSAEATGYYGPLTAAAVKAFQAARGIDQLGIVGPQTRAALNATAASAVGSGTDTAALLAQIAALQAQVVLLMQQLSALQ